MNKKTFQIVGLYIFLLLFFAQSISFAQGYNRIFKFAKGDIYETEVITNSNANITRGRQEIKVASTTNINKKYTVQQVDGQKVNMAAEVDKLVTDIDVNGVKTHFDSSVSADRKSSILDGISFIVNKPVSLTINNYGVIQDFQEYKLELATDTLASFAGIKQEVFTRSSLLSFLADLTYRKNLTKGYSWTDNINVRDQNLLTRFEIESVDEKTTVLKFSSKITSNLLNTNSNGTYVIDNATGIIKEKYIYTIAVGYEISAGKVVYTVSRTTNTIEKTRRR